MALQEVITKHKSGLCSVVVALFVLSCFCAFMIGSTVEVFKVRYPLSQTHIANTATFGARAESGAQKIERICRQFGLSPHTGPKRKIFYGALIADEPKIVFGKSFDLSRWLPFM